MKTGTLRLVALALATAVAPLLLSGCGSEPGPTNSPPVQPAASLPDGLFVTAAPDGAQELGAVKTSAKEGDTVIVRARIGGDAKPFVDGIAAVKVAGMQNITACSDRPDDPCQTPWDFCCDDPDDIAANTAILQVVGADGRPLKVSLRGAHGIKELSTVVVKATVGPRPDPLVLTLNAEAIFVEP